MPKLLTSVRWMPVLVLAASLSWPLVLSAAPVVIEIEIENYVVSVGKRADYFDGKLLTASDLSGDQDYKRGTDSLLGSPADEPDDGTLTLDDLFAAAGRGDVRLSLNCLYTDCVERHNPVDPEDPHHDDMIFLDPAKSTWFGRLYLKGVDGIEDGVYDGLSGSFDRLVSVDEPATTALVGLALVGLIAVRRHRVQGSA
ncbi:MAG: hypothetical protein IH627_04350 [Rubrivivax sp.]|nr:hypothetical protein [Rubrivivax sp.]